MKLVTQVLRNVEPKQRCRKASSGQQQGSSNRGVGVAAAPQNESTGEWGGGGIKFLFFPFNI